MGFGTDQATGKERLGVVSEGVQVAEIDSYTEHLRRHLGEVADREDASDRGCALLEFREEEPALVTVVTDGLRFQRITCLASFELTCTLRVEQRHIARHFIDSMARRMIANPDTLVQYGFVVGNNRPIVNGTRIQALLGCPSPYFRDGFDLLLDESGRIKVQTITLLPITSGEAHLVREKGMDALAELFWDKKPNLLDVTRESAA